MATPEHAMLNLALPSGSKPLNREIDRRDFPISLSFSSYYCFCLQYILYEIEAISMQDSGHVFSHIVYTVTSKYILYKLMEFASLSVQRYLQLYCCIQSLRCSFYSLHQGTLMCFFLLSMSEVGPLENQGCNMCELG